MKSSLHLINKITKPFLVFLPLLIVLPAHASSGYDRYKTPDSGVSFTDISAAIEFNRQVGEGFTGIAWIDYDNDDDLDLLITNTVRFNNGLFRNDGDNNFVDVTQEAGLTSVSGNSAVVVGDIDNDGYTDIFMSGTGGFVGPRQSPTRLYHNNGDGAFTDISVSANTPAGDSALSVAMADINNDGYLDLFVTGPGTSGTYFSTRSTK